jgi:inorganic pyrophosphatase
LIETAVIGNMQMIDAGKQDDKIIAVAVNDPSVNHIKSMEELPHIFSRTQKFFEQYKVLENKKVVIDNFQDRDTALLIINDAIDLYKQTFKK